MNPSLGQQDMNEPLIKVSTAIKKNSVSNVMLHKNQRIQLNISVITIWKSFNNLLYIWLILKFNMFFFFFFCFGLSIRSHGRVALLLIAWNFGLKLTTWWYICTRSKIIKSNFYWADITTYWKHKTHIMDNGCMWESSSHNWELL